MTVPLLRRALDAMLETSVVGSFTKVGYETRRRMFDWQDLGSLDMRGRTVVITGGNSGLGLVTAKALASMGASVRIVARDADRGRAALTEISAQGAPPAELFVADISSLDDVRRLAHEIHEREPRLDVLVHNAGALLGERRESVDGHEMTFATMVLGPHLLTSELVPLLRRTPGGARVVWIASGGMYTQSLDVGSLEMGLDDYDGMKAYARAKRAQVVLAEEWARRIRDDGVAVHAMHPGWADTPGVRSSLPRFRRIIRPLLRDAEQGADTAVWLATAEEPASRSGLFWHDREPRRTHRLPRTRETQAERERLWNECARLAGIDPQ